MESRGCAALWVLLLAQVSEQQTPACALGRAAAASGSPGDPQPPPFSGSSWLETGEYDLVSAYEVDHRGDYVSHDIMHYQRRRRRRAVTQPGGDALHLRLKGPRHDLHLDLKAASNLMAPGFMVQTLGKGGTKSVQIFPPEENCFYQGSLRSQGNSSVALSTCQGLLGMIRTKDTDYFLKPLPPHLTSKLNRSAQGDSPSHVLYKRSTERQVPRENEVLMITRKRDLARPHLHHDNFHLGPSQKQHFCGRRKKYMPQPPNDDLYILPDEYKPSSRHKRSLLKSHRNEELNVETLVVVDRKMMQSHGHENITTYVLTILNMVSALFKDGTIGGNINIVIVGLILLEDEQVFQLPKQRLFPLEENDCEKLLLVLMQSLCVLFISLLLGKRKISYFVFKMTHFFSFLMVVW